MSITSGTFFVFLTASMAPITFCELQPNITCSRTGRAESGCNDPRFWWRHWFGSGKVHGDLSPPVRTSPLPSAEKQLFKSFTGQSEYIYKKHQNSGQGHNFKLTIQVKSIKPKRPFLFRFILARLHPEAEHNSKTFSCPELSCKYKIIKYIKTQNIVWIGTLVLEMS